MEDVKEELTIELMKVIHLWAKDMVNIGPNDEKELTYSIVKMIESLVLKAKAFDAFGERLSILHNYLQEKENIHHELRDHATAARYLTEKNEVENIQLIYKELGKV